MTCSADDLLGGTDVHIRGLGSDPLVFGRVGTYSSVAQSNDTVAFSRDLSRPLPPPSAAVGQVGVFIQTRAYTGLNTQQTSTRLGAASVDGVIRTPQAYVDRPQLRVAFQLKDSEGSPSVDRSSLSGVQLEVSGGSLSLSSSCSTARVSSAAHYYLGSCHVPSVDSSWFAAGGTVATATLQMTRSDDPTVVTRE